MDTLSLQVNLPADLLSLLRLSQQEMEQEVQRLLALELFRTRRVSGGKAAQVAGLSVDEFMALTRQHNVAWVDYTDEELQAELQEAAAIGKAIREQNA